MIYGEKFLKLNENVISIDEMINIIENDIINIDILNEASLKDTFNNVFTKIKQGIEKIINFISNIVIKAFERLVNFTNKIIKGLKSKEKIDDRDINDMEKSLSSVSGSNIKESTIYEYSVEDEYDKPSDDQFRHFLRWTMPNYNSAVDKFKELCKFSNIGGKFNRVIDNFLDEDYDKLNNSLNELENEYNKFEEDVNNLLGHFENNYDKNDANISREDSIYNWRSYTFKKNGEDIYFASSEIASLQDTIVYDNEMIKSLKQLRNKLNELNELVDLFDNDKFKERHGEKRGHSEEVNKCFSIMSKYMSLSLRTTNDIINNYVACLKTNGKSLVSFAKYGYKNLYE